MRRLRIGILDLVTKSPNPSLYGRLMNANLASIMPQVLGVWCEQAGHDVSFVCYTGLEDLLDELPADLDILFIGAFTQSAQLSYALSNLFRKRGAVTVLGGPHARCYPEDASQYFDYVLGFTDRKLVEEVLRECTQHRPIGRSMSAKQQPDELPVARGALEVHRGDAGQGAADQDRADDRQPGLSLHLQLLHRLDGGLPAARLRARSRDDLGFLLTKMKNPIVGWHDPELRRPVRRLHGGDRGGGPAGVGCGTSPRAACRCSPSRTSSGCSRTASGAILPGIESWYDMGNKSKTRQPGMDKVKQVADHVNMILALHPVRPDQLRAGPGQRQGRRAVRADQAVPRPGARGLPGLLAAVRVRPGGAAQPRAISGPAGSCRSRSTSSTTTTR